MKALILVWVWQWIFSTLTQKLIFPSAKRLFFGRGFLMGGFFAVALIVILFVFRKNKTALFIRQLVFGL